MVVVVVVVVGVVVVGSVVVVGTVLSVSVVVTAVDVVAIVVIVRERRRIESPAVLVTRPILTGILQSRFTSWPVALVSIAEVRVSTGIRRHLICWSTSPPAAASIEFG